MIPEKSLVIYKNRPAIVTGLSPDKINISVVGGDALKVREKDIELIHPGPCSPGDLGKLEGNAREAWDLLLMDDNPTVSLKELSELIFGNFSPAGALAVWELIREGLYFSGPLTGIKARPRAEVEENERRLNEKQREAGEREAFLQKMKKLPSDELSPSDRRFLQDVEALARGQTDKSRTLKDLGKSETPVEAHKLLLASDAWTIWENPHPGRFGTERISAKIMPDLEPLENSMGSSQETRLDLSGLTSYAIDNVWSNDPDDAISLEGPDPEGCYTLWVHIADPTSCISPGSPADLEARDRGATLYLPEGASHMLCPEALPIFALGLRDQSPALSFKIRLSPDSNILDIDIIPSIVKVTRLSFSKADSLMEEGDEMLNSLKKLAEFNLEKRLNGGAVLIDFPEVHLTVNLKEGEKSVSVDRMPEYRSTGIVRECMLLAGEGSARWALQMQLPFPFISQEAGEIPEKILPGLAGAFQLRRSMRPRNLSCKSGVHWGLGLDNYTQVTSPLRRYTDLLCHQQIRARILGLKPLSEEEVLLRLMAAEAAAIAATRTERASFAHWMAVYLSDKKDSCWEGVILERKGSKAIIFIPDLGVETQISLRGGEEPNEKVELVLLSSNIPEGELNFSVH
ncbi:MAG: RNB domain-containing ribonuclease [Treponema sp.]|nr:RNB domain-containing ribonuclease [Treponema sp.]